MADGAALLDPAVTTRAIGAFTRQPAPGRPSTLDRLTPRKLDVLRQLGRGLSNVEMADELDLREATVKTHVARVLMKLWAYENGLIRIGEG